MIFLDNIFKWDFGNVQIVVKINQHKIFQKIDETIG